MKFTMRYSRFVLASFLCAVPALAQKPARVILPPKVVAGQPATLAVVDEDGRLLEGVTAQFAGGGRAVTDATGRATFSVPDQQGVLFVEAKSDQGVVRASTVVIRAPEAAPQGLTVIDVPLVLSLADAFTVGGHGFRGEADANAVLLGGREAIVLAASPASLVLVPAPGMATGPADLHFEVGAWKHGPTRVTLVSLEIAADPARIAPRKKGTLTVRARGINLPVELAIANHAPAIVEFPGGEPKMRVTTRGGADNAAVIELKGKQEGNYSVEVRLVAAAAGLPDTVLAHRELTKARQISVGERAKVLDRLIHHLAEHPQHYLEVRNELEKILAEAPQGDFGLYVEAAWRALLKK
jgi:hypothetical protein